MSSVRSSAELCLRSRQGQALCLTTTASITSPPRSWSLTLRSAARLSWQVVFAIRRRVRRTAAAPICNVRNASRCGRRDHPRFDHRSAQVLPLLGQADGCHGHCDSRLSRGPPGWLATARDAADNGETVGLAIHSPVGVLESAIRHRVKDQRFTSHRDSSSTTAGLETFPWRLGFSLSSQSATGAPA